MERVKFIQVFHKKCVYAGVIEYIIILFTFFYYLTAILLFSLASENIYISSVCLFVIFERLYSFLI